MSCGDVQAKITLPRSVFIIIAAFIDATKLLTEKAYETEYIYFFPYFFQYFVKWHLFWTYSSVS